MQKDAFKPVGREISVVGMGGPMMGGNSQPRMAPMMAAGPAAPRPSAPAPQAPMTVAPSGRGAQISGGKEVPRGAQMVRLASMPPPPLDGGPVDRSASFQPVGQAPMAPAPGPEMGGGPAPEAPRPFLQRMSNGQVTVFRVTMRGRAPDGAEYASVYDAEFPVGTQPLHLDFAPLT